MAEHGPLADHADVLTVVQGLAGAHLHLAGEHVALQAQAVALLAGQGDLLLVQVIAVHPVGVKADQAFVVHAGDAKVHEFGKGAQRFVVAGGVGGQLQGVVGVFG